MKKLIVALLMTAGIPTQAIQLGQFTNENRPSQCVCEVCWLQGNCVGDTYQKPSFETAAYETKTAPAADAILGQ